MRPDKLINYTTGVSTGAPAAEKYFEKGISFETRVEGRGREAGTREEEGGEARRAAWQPRRKKKTAASSLGNGGAAGPGGRKPGVEEVGRLLAEKGNLERNDRGERGEGGEWEERPEDEGRS
ncbi:hypothetical protein KM043_009298 [Ampulex compressa]|nr:hypothetical protein KM043_009298 [Ampulex compressa]